MFTEELFVDLKQTLIENDFQNVSNPSPVHESVTMRTKSLHEHNEFVEMELDGLDDIEPSFVVDDGIVETNDSFPFEISQLNEKQNDVISDNLEALLLNEESEELVEQPVCVDLPLQTVEVIEICTQTDEEDNSTFETINSQNEMIETLKQHLQSEKEEVAIQRLQARTLSQRVLQLESS